MKKAIILPILILFILTNCEKVVDVDVPTTAPKLVIDASFEVFFDETPVRANTTVKLRLSADYFDDTIPTVTNATVFVTNLSNGTIINFSDNNSDGDFEPTTTFIPEDNSEYELTVVYNSETFKGRATKIKSTPFTKIVQGDTTLFTGNETELEIFFTDSGTQDDYYLFDFTKNNLLTLEDRFFNGSDYNFSFFFLEDEIELPTNITVKISGITKEYFTYFGILIDQSGQSGGGPFQSVPSTILGNIVNTTNDDNFPLGYFHISETDTFNLDLVDKTK